MGRRLKVKGRRGGPKYSEARAWERLVDACDGLNPVAVAKMTGLNYETVRRQLAADGGMTLAFVAEVCAAIGVSADWVLFGESAARAGKGRTGSAPSASLAAALDEAELAVRRARRMIGAGSR